MSCTPGMRLADRYVLTDRIGTGGMSEVWRATDEVLGRSVAVKVLAPRLAADAALRATTRQEARAAAGLTHPHITQVYDYGEAASADGTPIPYLVMELVQGQALDVRLQAGPLPWQQAVQIGADVADALRAAHRLGIVHRDVKPGNVMLTPQGVKVLDFGVAGLTGGQAGADGGWLVGTPMYAAPEQARGAPVDPAADMYSFGVLLYECLTGRPPRSIDRWADLAAAPTGPVPPPQAPGLPADVAALVARCLHPDPARRPSATQAVETLDATAGRPARVDEPTVMIPAYQATARVVRPTMVEPMPSDAPAAPAPPRRKRVGVVAACAAAALVLIALVTAAALGSRDTPAPETAPARTPGSAAPQVSDSPAAPSPAPAPTDIAGVLAALRADIDAGIAAGDIDATAAQKLRGRLQEAGRGKGRGKQKRGNDILATINELARQGHIAPERADQLRAVLQPIAAPRDEE